jgi:hypothetical protein
VQNFDYGMLLDWENIKKHICNESLDFLNENPLKYMQPSQLNNNWN